MESLLNLIYTQTTMVYGDFQWFSWGYHTPFSYIFMGWTDIHHWYFGPGTAWGTCPLKRAFIPAGTVCWGIPKWRFPKSWGYPQITTVAVKSYLAKGMIFQTPNIKHFRSTIVGVLGWDFPTNQMMNRWLDSKPPHIFQNCCGSNIVSGLDWTAHFSLVFPSWVLCFLMKPIYFKKKINVLMKSKLAWNMLNIFAAK